MSFVLNKIFLFILLSCIAEHSYVINRPNFNCETHASIERIYVNGCCKTSWCSANLTLDTSKLFERGIPCYTLHVTYH